MSTRSHLRLLVLHVLVISLLVTLTGRLWYLQILTGERFDRAAAETRTRDVHLPATRGEIYDSTGRSLVDNRSKLVVSVSRSELSRLPNDGEAVLHRLAELLPDASYDGLQKRLRLCSSGVEKPCWNGSPYQPIPVADDVPERTALQIMERKTAFPGVTARVQAVREYPSPGGAQTAHVLGRLAPITEKEYEQRKRNEKRLSASALVGRDGLEATYEQHLRGTPGAEDVVVDSQGRVTGTLSKTPPVPGSNLVTSINAKVQADVEAALQRSIERARGNGAPADAAAGVVLDVRTGRVIAMASQPSFDPSVWVGGISPEKYEQLRGDEANQPMVNRATQGEYPVGSTFKPVSLAAAVKAGWPLDGTYPCPGGYQVGNRTWTNYESTSYGTIDLHRSLVISCDTVFYRFAHLMWKRNGGATSNPDRSEPIPQMAEGFGLHSETGIDLPSESAGRIPDPKWKHEYWKQSKAHYCKRAKKGYPDVAKDNPERAAYLEKLAREQCKRGNVWRASDAVNLSIGQGDMLATPLQLARAYAAIANGGTVYSPKIGKAIVDPDGSVVKKITPSEAGTVPVRDEVLSYIQDALADVPRSGTAAGVFGDFPLGKIPVAGKTGTAQAYGEEDTAWFASFAPADDPRFAVAVAVSQGGLGSEAAAPAVREIYEGIYGVGDRKAAFPNGAPPQELPSVGRDGNAEQTSRASAAATGDARSAATRALGVAPDPPAAAGSATGQPAREGFPPDPATPALLATLARRATSRVWVHGVYGRGRKRVRRDESAHRTRLLRWLTIAAGRVRTAAWARPSRGPRRLRVRRGAPPGAGGGRSP